MKTYRKEPQKQDAKWKRLISQETECTKFNQSGVLFTKYFPGRILPCSFCFLSPELKRKDTTVMMAPGVLFVNGSPKIHF
jgi:hypothetical protein